MTKLTAEPIVILGTFRSGTSALATALNALGVFFGAEKDFYPANEFNPGGFWELEDMQVLNSQCLSIFGMNFYQVDRLPDDWRLVPGGMEAVNQIRSLLHRHFERHARWGFKEPATSVLMPVYKEAFEAEALQPRYAISVRHPLSVAASQRRRQSDWGYKEALESGAKDVAPVEDRTLGLWIHFTLSSLKETQGKPRLIVSYENFLKDPRPYLAGLTTGIESWKPTEEEMEAGVATVKPEWSHSRYSLEDLKAWPSIVFEVYDCCLKADRDPEGLAAGKFDSEIDGLWDKWVLMSKMLRPMNLLPSQFTFSWREQGGNRQETLPFMPTGSWQTIRKRLDAPAGATIQIDPYQSPCQIWIRKAAWHANGEEKMAGLSPGQGGVMENPGVLRLTVFGPGALLVKAPTPGGSAELELEFRVQTDQAVLTNVIGTLRGKIEQVRRGSGPSFGATGRR